MMETVKDLQEKQKAKKEEKKLEKQKWLQKKRAEDAKSNLEKQKEERARRLKETGVDMGPQVDVPPEGDVELGEPFLDSESSDEDPLN